MNLTMCVCKICQLIVSFCQRADSHHKQKMDQLFIHILNREGFMEKSEISAIGTNDEISKLVAEWEALLKDIDKSPMGCVIT